MALIKCSECKKNVSTLASSCPHCGAPVAKEIKEEKASVTSKQKELEKIDILKEKSGFITIAVPLIISTLMLISFLLFEIDGYYLLEYRGLEYELTNCLTRRVFHLEVLIAFGAIGCITFISYILTIISKKTTIVAKLGYIVNIIIEIIFFIEAFDNDFRVGTQYFVIFGLNILLFLCPRTGKVVAEETLIPPFQREKIEKKNSKLEKIYSKKRFTPPKVAFTLIVTFIALLSMLLIYNKNFDSVETYEQKNPMNYPQLKVKIDYIAVREKPSTSSEFLGRVYRGDIYNILEVIDKENNSFIWYKIKYEGDIAYVASNRDKPYVKIIESKSNTEDENFLT